MTEIIVFLAAKPALFVFFAACFGAAMGSFFNVVIWRLPQIMEREWLTDIKEWFQEEKWAFPKEAEKRIPALHKSLAYPASACPHCSKPIPLWFNVPVFGWLVLKGRGACCGKPISARYPLIEATCSVIAAAVAFKYGPTVQFLAACAFVYLLVVLAAVDFDTNLLPDGPNLSLLWAGLVFASLGWTPTTLSQSLWGCVVGYAGLGSVRLLGGMAFKREAMGAGDPKLMAAIGAWIGPAALIPAILIASVSGVVGGLVIQQTRGMGKGAHIPFGPFLALGGAIVFFFKPQIMSLLGF